MAYKSAVGQHLVTRVDEPQLLTLLAVLLTGLIGVNLYLRREERVKDG